MSLSQSCFRTLSKFPLKGSPSSLIALSFRSIQNYLDQGGKRNYANDTCQPPVAKCKVAIVTGGAGGIGLAIVKHLVKNGAQAVVMADVNEEMATCNMEAINKEAGCEKVLFQKCDASKRSDLEQVFECTKDKFHKIDIVVNNAGILADSIWDKTICINAYGLVMGTLLGFEYMGMHNCSGNGGTVINVASILGFSPCHGSPVYTATKHFVVGFTRSIGDKWFYNKTGVKIMALCPGVTESDMTEEKNMIERGGYTDIGEAGKELANALNALPKQPADECGKHVIHMLQHGCSADLWISENFECYRVIYPEFRNWKDSKNALSTKSDGCAKPPAAKCGPPKKAADKCGDAAKKPDCGPKKEAKCKKPKKSKKKKC